MVRLVYLFWNSDLGNSNMTFEMVILKLINLAWKFEFIWNGCSKADFGKHGYLDLEMVILNSFCCIFKLEVTLCMVRMLESKSLLVIRPVCHFLLQAETTVINQCTQLLSPSAEPTYVMTYISHSFPQHRHYLCAGAWILMQGHPENINSGNLVCCLTLI